MKTRTTVYWATTGILVFALVAGGLADAIHLGPVLKGMARLGYPPYFLTILGLWKILGGLALAWPGLPALKEWAYAGVFFVMTGAAISHAVCGEKAYVIAPVLLGAMGVVSWKLRPLVRAGEFGVQDVF
jgi:hypothetical protein